MLEEASNMLMILVKSSILKLPEKNNKVTTVAEHNQKHCLAAYTSSMETGIGIYIPFTQNRCKD